MITGDITINITMPDASPADRVGLAVNVNGCRYEFTPVSRRAVPLSGGAWPDIYSLLTAESERLDAAFRYCTARNYRAAAAALLRFGAGALPLERLTPDEVVLLQQRMSADGLAANTVSLYMRVYRAVYNKYARARGLADLRPFDAVTTAVQRTAKRALTLSQIRRIRRCRLADSAVRFARDMFLFSFYACGMPFIDMAYLAQSNVSDGMLTYNRHKTGQPIAVRWNEPLQDIVNSHPSVCEPYLLPLITRANGKERSQYRRKQQVVNECLKEVAREAGIGSNLTLYVARHSWASIAIDNGASLYDVSQGLGHTNLRTTRIYVNSLAQDRLAAVNSAILAQI